MAKNIHRLYMTFTNNTHKQPRCIRVIKPLDKIDLIVRGQGVLIFDASECCHFTFCDMSGNAGLKVSFTDSAVIASLLPSDEPLIDVDNTRGIIKSPGAYYWFSLDAQNQRLYAGVGEARKETAIYSFQLKSTEKSFLESLVSVKLDKMRVTSILRDPITRSVPLLVKNTDDFTMESIALNNYMPKANLSLVSQKLYDCIAGKQFILNTPDFPDFTKAIEYSIATPGLWCYECLKQKATEFDKDKPDYRETYLRITLGENNGESPGIPYVMEIWPVGHYSPIHNHGGASAIIRVLNGSINVSLFPFLSGDAVIPFGNADFKRDDITWISPMLNQVHQLKNLETNKDTCITIQCYMYEAENIVHYDFFDYLNGDGSKHQFEPNSDMDFVDFKKIIKKEWDERLSKRWFGF